MESRGVEKPFGRGEGPVTNAERDSEKKKAEGEGGKGDSRSKKCRIAHDDPPLEKRSESQVAKGGSLPGRASPVKKKKKKKKKKQKKKKKKKKKKKRVPPAFATERAWEKKVAGSTESGKK